MRNYLNTNDIFPILEIVRREIRKNDFDKNRTILLNGDEVPVGRPDDVTSVELLRGGNAYDPELIDSVVVTYVDGSVETITLIRGANPPVPDTVPDHEFINNALISGFTVDVSSSFGNRRIIGNLIRENGYGKILKLELSYIDG